MSVQHIMPNGEVVPVPREIVAQGNAAQQAFYDTQLARLAIEADDERRAPLAPGSDA